MTSDGVQLNGFANGSTTGVNMSNAASNLGLNWNPKHLEIKTRSVEKTLEPLVMQVTTLVSSKSPQKKKGKSKRAHVLVAAVERATANFVERGRIIARENPEIEPEMLQAVDEVQHTGETMSAAAREFATDPCSSVKRGNMVSSSTDLIWKSADAAPKIPHCNFPPSLESPNTPSKSALFPRTPTHYSQVNCSENGIKTFTPIESFQLLPTTRVLAY